MAHGSNDWRRHLAFRDLLRARPDLREEYAQLKRELAARYGNERMAYADAKTPFIEATLAQGQKGADRP